VTRWNRWAGSLIWPGAGPSRLIVNGSFVTDKLEPNDVDCALLVGPEFPRDATLLKELNDGLPFIELKLAEEPDFAVLVEKIFATDRDWVSKGMIEVLL
jgi:hypothetical protein